MPDDIFSGGGVGALRTEKLLEVNIMKNIELYIMVVVKYLYNLFFF